MTVFAYSGVGGRKVNQDFLAYATMDNKHAVFIVADGMGGYSHGEIAAQVAASAVKDYVEENYKSLEPEVLLREAVAFANESISIKRIALHAKQMGTVIVVAYVCDNTAWIAWVGDSRVYVMRDGKPIFQTEDHSLINELRQVNTLKAADLVRMRMQIQTSSRFPFMKEIPFGSVQMVSTRNCPSTGCRMMKPNSGPSWTARISTCPTIIHC